MPAASREPDARPTAAWPEVNAGEFAVRGGVIRMPMTYGLVAVAAIVVAVVVAWAAGFMAGESKAQAEAEARLNALAPGGANVREPEAWELEDGVIDPDAEPSRGAPVEPERALSAQPAANPPIDAAAPPPAFDATGALAGDPRTLGLNYLVLGELEFEPAAEAIERLAAAGVGAVAVRVDSRGRGSNNPARYALFTVDGLTAEQYRSDRAARTARLEAVKRAGARWRAEGGPTDFSTAYWDKLD